MVEVQRGDGAPALALGAVVRPGEQALAAIVDGMVAQGAVVDDGLVPKPRRVLRPAVLIFSSKASSKHMARRPYGVRKGLLQHPVMACTVIVL